jgi:O-antigen ligase
LFYLIILIPIVIFFKNLSFLAPQSSFTRRSQLANISLEIFKQHPLTGIGLNNFTAVMEHYGFITATTRFLQPVHNIYLLILSETGLIGFIGFLCLILSPLITRQRSLFLIPYLSLLFLGLFDHYPLTLQPSTLLLFILFGLLNQPKILDKISDSN